MPADMAADRKVQPPGFEPRSEAWKASILYGFLRTYLWKLTTRPRLRFQYLFVLLKVLNDCFKAFSCLFCFVMKGKFIVLDGIDGCGKTTQLSLIENFFKEKGFGERVLVTAEPTKGVFGKQIREVLAKEEDAFKGARLCLDLFVKDRKEHLEKELLPALEQGKIVLCDRYKYASIAYQHAQGIPLNEVIDANKGFPVPDLVLILDLPVETGLQRVHKDSSRNVIEKFEKKEYLTKVRGCFNQMKKLFPDENIVVIDAAGNPDQVFGQIKKELEKL